MTFKHIKFGDSPTMRALEKVAREKGLVKDEPMQKTADTVKKADITPTSNLMQNVFKLCTGLREKGFIAEAAELELNYLNYKQAQTLYEAHKEKGEDLLHDAHPDGSHKLEGIEGTEATVEDLLDRHSKIMQTVEKKPTGKLSSAAHLISEVKKALGQDTTEIQNAIDTNVRKARAKWNVFHQRVSDEGELSGRAYDFWKYSKPIEAAFNVSPMTLSAVNQILTSLASLERAISPGWSGGVPGNIWPDLKSLLDQVRALLGPVKENIQRNYHQQSGEEHPVSTEHAPVAPDLEKKIKGVAAQYSALAAQITSEDPKDAEVLDKTKAWLNQKAAALVSLAEKFHNEVDKDSVTPVYQATLNKYQNALTKIQQEWS